MIVRRKPESFPGGERKGANLELRPKPHRSETGH